jgi:hypothetical protein
LLNITKRCHTFLPADVKRLYRQLESGRFGKTQYPNN